jgi:hypothetical protein
MKKFKTRQEIANEIGICVKTLNSKLQQNNVQLAKGLITPKNQEIIYSLFGISAARDNSLDE